MGCCEGITVNVWTRWCHLCRSGRRCFQEDKKEVCKDRTRQKQHHEIGTILKAGRNTPNPGKSDGCYWFKPAFSGSGTITHIWGWKGSPNWTKVFSVCYSSLLKPYFLPFFLQKANLVLYFNARASLSFRTDLN